MSTDANLPPASLDNFNCDQDPAAALDQAFVGILQHGAIKLGQIPAQRPSFIKPHGVALGRFEVDPNLPPDQKVGVFALGTLPACVRFSSDASAKTPDLRTTCGIGIKLFNVDGPKLLGDGSTQDFVLQNHDVYFVDTATDMCEYTRALVVEGNVTPYLNAHPITKQILDDMMKVEPSVLTASYWSAVPSAFGEGRFVKYKLEPETQPSGVPPDDPNYMAADLIRRLLAGEARFRFMVQFRTDDATMPLDQATVRWDEKVSPFVQVATLILPKQDILERGLASYGENLSFNPWHSLEAHTPQGSLSAARKRVYAASAVQRRDANGVPIVEPRQPRLSTVRSLIVDRPIVSASIYPGIGIARVGNSRDEFFIGPEVADPLPEDPGFYRDPSGALKRQAARFRIYGYDAEGEVVAELTPENAQIEWTVHLANKKSAWYQFQLALDIPEAASVPPSLLRNGSVSDRSSLVIDPGARSISGIYPNGGPGFVFDTGKFRGTPVYLGELRTDDKGRLIVLGGRGATGAFDNSLAITFANNDGWYDDIADGPVTATVQYNGRTLSVAPAWVVVAPPNFAPLQKSVRTMWDLMRDVAIPSMLPAPVRPSFNAEIRPIFERLSALQWVNRGFASGFGWGSPNNLADPDLLLRLSKNNPNDAELRRTIANQFRVFTRDGMAAQLWPWMYGDAMGVPNTNSPRQYASLTNTQLNMLQEWAAGNFDSDYDPAQQPARTLDEVPLADQPAMLDRASLEFCLADAFHPGSEMTWPMRTRSMYMSPFRIEHAPVDWIEPYYGAALNSSVTSLPNGPLAAQVPGGITRWMAVPWQCDSASCRSGYDGTYDCYLPSFWAARVPNQVLTQDNYEIVMDKSRPLADRQSAFASRADWDRGLGTASYVDILINMLKDFSHQGVVEYRVGPDDGHFPTAMQVESLSDTANKRLADAKVSPHASTRLDLTGIEKVRRFPHGLR